MCAKATALAQQPDALVPRLFSPKALAKRLVQPRDSHGLGISGV